MKKEIERTHLSLAEWAMSIATGNVRSELDGSEAGYKAYLEHGDELMTAAKEAVKAEMFEHRVLIIFEMRLNFRFEPPASCEEVEVYPAPWWETDATWFVDPQKPCERNTPIDRMLHALAVDEGTEVQVSITKRYDQNHETLIIAYFCSDGNGVLVPDRFLHAMAEKMRQWASGQ